MYISIILVCMKYLGGVTQLREWYQTRRDYTTDPLATSRYCQRRLRESLARRRWMRGARRRKNRWRPIGHRRPRQITPIEYFRIGRIGYCDVETESREYRGSIVSVEVGRVPEKTYVPCLLAFRPSIQHFTMHSPALNFFHPVHIRVG